MKIAGIMLMILITYSILVTFYYLRLRHRVKASKDPYFDLTRRQRRARALEYFERVDESYEDKRNLVLEQQVKGFLSPDLSTHRKESSFEAHP